MIPRLRAMLGSGEQKVVARVSLAVTATLVLLAMVFAGPSGAAGFVLAQASGSPSPSGPAGAIIKWVNPGAYDPGYSLPPRQGDDPPKISDRADGRDEAYHLVAWVNQVPTNAVVEAGIIYDGENEATVGTLQPMAGVPDTFEAFWEIPDSFDEGSATLVVRLFSQAGGGAFTELSKDEIEVDMQHQGDSGETPPNPEPADETITFTWPTPNGPLGFFKSSSGPWRTVVDVSTSDANSEYDIFYTTSDPGNRPTYVECGHGTTFGHANFLTGQPLSGRAVCTLPAAVSPPDVTALVAVALEGDEPERQDVPRSELLTQDSADVVRFQAYAIDPAKMNIEIVPTHHATKSANYPTGARRLAASDCLELDIFVTDDLERPVVGANIDVHAVGPTDQIGFAQEGSTAHGTSGFAQPAGHASESARLCDDFIDTPQNDTGSPDGVQSEHNVPGGDDVKHRETATAGTSSSGSWRFALYSTDVGKTELTAWVDEEPTPADLKTARAANDDLPEVGEPSTTSFVQWMPGSLRLAFEPAGGSAIVNDCHRYVLRARAGNAVVDHVNVDVHATGPENSLNFCDPSDGSLLRAPDDEDADHQSEGPAQGAHAGSPLTKHTEGETNEAGNFVFGLTSPVEGDSTIIAWVDGEPGTPDENDVQDTTDVSASATHSWGVSAADATVRFINPSGYGGGAGDNISIRDDADKQYHLVARTNAIEPVPVEFLIRAEDADRFTKIGDGTRVGLTDTYELFWNLGLADGTYVLRVQIPGSDDKFEDRTITVNSNPADDQPNPEDPDGDPSFEAAEITSPINGTPAAFTRDGLRVTGFASTGTEQVRVFYTRSSATQVRDAATWTQCANVSSGGSGGQGERFEAQCKMQAGDIATGVTGIAAVAIDCHATFGCEQSAGPISFDPRVLESGDAHRVFGFASDALLSLEPAEAEGQVDSCQRMTLVIQDQTGQPIEDADVDIHLSGPSDQVNFCDPEDPSARTAPNEGSHTGSESDESVHPDPMGNDTHHTEGTTGGQGRFVFGVSSTAAGSSTILAWADVTENDEPDLDERADTSTMHWVDPAKEPPKSGGCTKVGTAGRDVLIGTKGKDKLCGKGGNDVLRGRGGNDVLLGGRGNDRVIGGKGRDKLRGGGGRDVLRAAQGKDTLSGGRGRDRLNGGGRRDDCDGGVGRDKFKKCERRRR